MIAARALSRLAGIAWMAAIALAGLAVAAYCLDGAIGLGSARPDHLLHLPSVRRHVGHALRQLGDPGPLAAVALLCGLGAMLLGLVLVIGLLAPRRPGVVALTDSRGDDDDGVLAVRPATLRAMLRAQAEQVPAVVRVGRPRLRVGRLFTRGRVRVVPSATAAGDASAVRREVQEALAPVTEPFSVRSRVDVSLQRRRPR